MTNWTPGSISLTNSQYLVSLLTDRDAPPGVGFDRRRPVVDPRGHQLGNHNLHLQLRRHHAAQTGGSTLGHVSGHDIDANTRHCIAKHAPDRELRYRSCSNLKENTTIDVRSRARTVVGTTHMKEVAITARTDFLRPIFSASGVAAQHPLVSVKSVYASSARSGRTNEQLPQVWE